MDDFAIQVYSSLDFEAIHHFPFAGEQCKQGYLAHPHRHIFRIKCMWKALHTNRDREFIDVQHDVRTFLIDKFPKSPVTSIANFGPRSCEDIARLILVEFQFLNAVEVSEDGENGAILKRT